jgi:hypothetical protein
MYTVDLHHLDDLIERADLKRYTQGIDAAKMFTMLRNEKVNQHTTSWVWPITVIVASIGCGALWPVWIKLIKKCCPWVRKYITCTLRPTMTTTAQRLNDDDRFADSTPKGQRCARRNYVKGLFQRRSRDADNTHRIRWARAPSN